MAKDPTVAELAREVRSLREEILRLRVPGGGVVDPGPDDWGRWPPPRRFPPIPQPGDPAPFDRARFRVVLGLDLRQVAARILNVSTKELTLEDVGTLHLGDVIGIEPGPVVDPAPDDVGRWVRIDPRLIPLPPVADPPPFDLSRLRPVPNVRLVEAVAKIRGSSPEKLSLDDLSEVTVRDLVLDLSDLIDDVVDPSPIDFSRFAALGRRRVAASELSPREISAMDERELEAAGHRLQGEITRLEGLQKLVERKKEALGGGGKG